jgi:hypothetical protein
MTRDIEKQSGLRHEHHINMSAKASIVRTRLCYVISTRGAAIIVSAALAAGMAGASAATSNLSSGERRRKGGRAARRMISLQASNGGVSTSGGLKRRGMSAPYILSIIEDILSALSTYRCRRQRNAVYATLVCQWRRSV